MHTLKVAAASLNQTPLDWAGNQANIIAAIRLAREADVSVLCLPELCITGYGCEDAFLSTSNCQLALESLLTILPETKKMMVALGLPILFKDLLYNAACLVADGKILGFVAKQNLAGDGVHYEPRWFKPWPQGRVEDVSIGPDLEQTYPIGDFVFEINDLKIGFEICEDAWAVPRTGVRLAERGVDLILNPSASHFAFHKYPQRKRFVQEGAKAFGVGYIYANLLGNEAGRLIYDGDTFIAAGNEMIAEGKRFSFESCVLTTGVLNIERLRQERSSLEFHPKVQEQKNCVHSEAAWFSKVVGGQASETSDALAVETWAQDPLYLQEEEFTRATALGLFDYLRKSHARGFVINLSGGADSAACAGLVYFMVVLGIQALGEQAFKERLHLKKIPALKELLFCIYQRTENSSTYTADIAKGLATTLGASFIACDVNPLVQGYQALISAVIKRPLTWEKDDIALQNIQARSRAPSAWLLANLQDFILLCCSNRSEAAVGYATMDGDMAGGLAPLAGVDKVFILKWLAWLAKVGPDSLGALPYLQKIVSEPPTAELKPLRFQQTDEQDLMPYVWLERIERLFVRDKRSPLEILVLLRKEFVEETPERLAGFIEKFFRLFAQNQWKRERLAPSFHLDDENIDPRSWCRFPILSGGFKKELKIMWQSLK